MRCPSDTISMARKQAFQAFLHQLKLIHTPSPIRVILRNTIGRFIKCRRKVPICLDKHDNRESLIYKAVLSQDIIGWNELFRGKISTYWKQAVIAFTDDSSSKSMSRWSAKLVDALISLSLQLWNIRNDHLHRPEEPTTDTEQDQLLYKQISNYYRWYKRILPRRYRKLFCKSPIEHTKLHKNPMSLRKWLETIDVIVSTKLNQPAKALSQSHLLRYFHKGKLRKKSSRPTLIPPKLTSKAHQHLRHHKRHTGKRYKESRNNWVEYCSTNNLML